MVNAQQLQPGLGASSRLRSGADWPAVPRRRHHHLCFRDRSSQPQWTEASFRTRRTHGEVKAGTFNFGLRLRANKRQHLPSQPPLADPPGQLNNMGTALDTFMSYLRIPLLASSGIAALCSGLLYFKQKYVSLHDNSGSQLT